MKNQARFSSKDKSKELKCCLLQFLFGALRVNICEIKFWWFNEMTYWHILILAVMIYHDSR